VTQRPFTHRYPPQRVHFCADAASALELLLAARGVGRALLVCGEKLSAGQLARQLVGIGRVAGVWTGVRPHTPADSIDEGAARYSELEADAVVSLGGGSAHDTMRGIALGATTGRRIRDEFPDGARFVRLDPVVAMPSLFAIPTTMSAAETSFGGGTVFADQKWVFTGDSLYVGDIILDPDAFATTPADVLLASGMNAMHHAVGRLLSTSHQPIADGQFLQALRLLGPALARLGAQGADDRDALGDAIVGAHLSGSTNVVGGIGHGVAHVLGGRYGIPHGVAHALALVHVTAPLTAHDLPRARLIADALEVSVGERSSAEALHAWLRDLLSTLQLPARLRDAGVPQNDIDAICADVAADFSTSNTNSRYDLDRLRELVRLGW
jgi:alcohol dehydrogenase class IV